MTRDGVAMWQLNRDNAIDWLRQSGLLVAEPVHVEPLGGGVSGVVLRVEVGGRRIVLKQACPQLRTHEAWFSDPRRIIREQEVMDLLCPLLPPGTIPRVIHLDRERFVLAMEHAPEAAAPWKAQLLTGQIDPARAGQAGRLLARIHATTAERRGQLSHLAERTVFVQLRVDPFYRSIQARHPDLAGRIEPLIEEMLTRREALCHGDFSPKNLLVHDGGLTLVDHETAHLGEPAMDVGFFFSHLVLKSFRSPTRWHEWKRLLDAGIRDYDWPGAEEVLRRGLDHMAVCLVARVDGTSPVDYLPDEVTREAVRGLGRRLLTDRVTTWNAALDRVAGALTPLHHRG